MERQGVRITPTLSTANVVSFCSALITAASLQAADSVAVENTKPGTTAWQLTNRATMFQSNDLNPADWRTANAETPRAMLRGPALIRVARSIFTSGP